jgi:hypothetical protein
MWTWKSNDAPDTEPDEWLAGRTDFTHLVAAYQVTCGRGRENSHQTLGIASPFPQETYPILHHTLTKIGVMESEPSPLATRLDPEVIAGYVKARVSSVRFEASPGYQLERYADPIEVSDLTGTRPISAMSLYLCDSPGTPHLSLVSLFTSNQFYVTDCPPGFVGEVARQVCPLWGYTEE